jgi:anti-sigma B factor antagonist
MASKVSIIYHIGVIKIRGTLKDPDETKAVRNIEKGLIEENINKIVIDLSRVKWINSTGLGMLMACFSSVHNKNGRIGLVKISDKVLKIMSITRVHKLFDHFDSIKEAVKAYRLQGDNS